MTTKWLTVALPKNLVEKIRIEVSNDDSEFASVSSYISHAIRKSLEESKK